jgi:hypothetical protein
VLADLLRFFYLELYVVSGSESGGPGLVPEDSFLFFVKVRSDNGTSKSDLEILRRHGATSAHPSGPRIAHIISDVAGNMSTIAAVEREIVQAFQDAPGCPRGPRIADIVTDFADTMATTAAMEREFVQGFQATSARALEPRITDVIADFSGIS